MKLFSRKPESLTGIIHDPPKHGPKSGPVRGSHRDTEAWRIPRGGLVEMTPSVSEAVIENPKPYRGAVAKNVQRKMVRENVNNYLELTKMGAKEQAWAQLWSNFTKICYAVGVPVDTNADLRIH